MDRAIASGAIGREFESLRAHHTLPILRLRSGFRLRAPAPLTPAKRLKFESLRAHHTLPILRLHSGFRLWAPASLTPAKRLKFESLRAHHVFPTVLGIPAADSRGCCGLPRSPRTPDPSKKEKAGVQGRNSRPRSGMTDWPYRPKYLALRSVNDFHFSGRSSSAKMAETGQTGTQAPQSMHSTGSM